jgi:hypothetical protein
VGCTVRVVCTAEVISRDDEMGFGSEMRLADEEDVDMVEC